MACEYKFKGGNQTYDYEGIVNFIIGEMGSSVKTLQSYLTSKGLKNMDVKLLDIVFSEELKGKIASEQLKSIAKEVKLVKRSWGESYSGAKDSDKYIDLYDYIEGSKGEGGRRVNNERYVTQYDKNELRGNLIRQYISEGKSREAAEKLADDKLQMHANIEDTGYYIHYILNKYFHGDSLADNPARMQQDLFMIIPDHLRETFSVQFITSVLEQAKDIKKQIMNYIGLDSTIDYKVIFPNFGIDAKIEGSEKLLYQNVDLVAIDKNGTPHIYMFKISSKLSAEQPSVVDLKRDYYLAFTRQMFIAKGVDMSKASLNIVPINLEINESKGIPTGVMFEEIQDRRTDIKKDGTNNLTLGSGRLANDARAVISSDYVFEKGADSIADEVFSKMKEFFPKQDLQIEMDSATVKGFIKGHFIRESADPEYAYEFDDRIDGKTIRIKDSSPKENNEELKKKVTEYLKKKKEQRAETATAFIDKISKVVEGDLSLSRLMPTSQGKANLFVNLGRYSTGGYKMLDIPALEELGIVALQNKTTDQVDFIMLSGEYDLNTDINLGLGKSILGSFKKDTQVENDQGLLKANMGSIQLMQMMQALNILYQKDETFRNLEIGDVKVFNIVHGISTMVQSSMLRHSFAALCKETGQENYIHQAKWLSDVDLIRNNVQSLLASKLLQSNAMLSNFQSELEGANTFTKQEMLRHLIEFNKTLEKSYRYLKDWDTAKQTHGDAYQQEIVNLWLLINQSIVYLKGNYFQQVKALGQMGTLANQNLMEGRLLATPDNISDANIAKVTSLVRESFVMIRDIFSGFQEKLYHDTLEPFYKSKGYSKVQNVVIGNQAQTFRNLYREKDGKIMGQMLFKDPYDPSSDLTAEERTLLKKALWIINKRRFKLYNKTESDPEVEALKKTTKWFWVPLMKGDMSSRMNSEYIKETITSEAKNIISGIKRSKELLSKNQEEIYTEQEKIWADEHEERYEMHNRFDRSEADAQTRQELLDSENIGFWETNLENILLQYELASIRKEVLDEALPIVKAYKIVLEAYGDITNVNTSDNVKYLTNFIKQAVYNRLTLSEEEKAFTKHLMGVKQLTSTLMVAGNIVAPIRDVIQGMWKTIGIFVADTWGEAKGFTKKDYLWAVGKMMKPDMETIKICESLNKRMGITNFDINILAKRARSGRHGIFNFRDKLFWTSTAGDYFNRMTLVLAKMHHDGCFEACKFDNGFEYDWKQDKRFSVYASGKTEHPKYKEQRALYLSYIRDFNEQGYSIKQGDPLPFPYTPKEVNLIKSFADRMYGYYDHDVRMQAERTALGMVGLQFATYLTALKTQWFASPGMRDSLQKVQQTDDNGNPLYWKEEKDADGKTIYVPTTENTGEPIMITGQTYMEGIFYTVYNFSKDVKNLGLKGAIGNIKDTDIKKQNLKQLGYQLFIWAILGAIIKYLLALWKEDRKADKSPYTISKALGDQTYHMASKSLLGSLSDFNIVSSVLGVVDGEPPMVAMVTNLTNSTWDTAFGDKTFGQWCETNVSMYRNVSALTKGLQKVSAAVEGSINEAQD